MTDENTKKIAGLNDLLRETFMTGKVRLSYGVTELGEELKEKLISEVRSYSDFTEGNDPYGERDFGAIELEGGKFYWKIDYYDRNLEFGSEDPADPKKTVRVLTIMRSCEY